MAALTAPRMATDHLGDSPLTHFWKLPVKAATKIYAGAAVVIDAGYAAPARTATGLLSAGRAEATVDNTGGAAGAKWIEVRRGAFAFNNSASADLISQADVGKECFFVDDNTVALTSATSTRSRAGIIMQLEGGQVYVQLGALT